MTKYERERPIQGLNKHHPNFEEAIEQYGTVQDHLAEALEHLAYLYSSDVHLDRESLEKAEHHILLAWDKMK